MSANTSRIDTNEIDAQFLEDVLSVLTAQDATFYVTAGNRAAAVEAAGFAAYKADPAHAPKFTDPRLSAHVGENFPDKCARAVDVTLVRDGKDIWDYSDPAWMALKAAVYAHPRLHSGADFTDAEGRPTPDDDHIEKRHWQLDIA